MEYYNNYHKVRFDDHIIYMYSVPIAVTVIIHNKFTQKKIVLILIKIYYI